MKTHYALHTLLVLCTLVCGLPETVAQKFKLGYKLEKGQAFSFEELTKTSTVQNIMGREQKVEQQLVTGYTFTIDDVNQAGNYVTTVTYDYIALNIDQLGQKIQYDSRKDQEYDMQTASYAGLVGSKLELEFTTTGKVLKVSGVKVMIDSILAKQPNLTEAQLSMVEQIVSSQYNDTTLRNTMGNMLEIYPAQKSKVKVGEVWTKADKMQAGFMAMNIGVSHTLLGKEADKLKIGLTSEFDNEGGDEVSMQGMTMKMALTGNASGELRVDSKTGWIHSKQYRQQMDGTVEVIAGNEMLKGQSWPITINAEGSIKRLD